jgi:hypothetical protein
MIAAEEFGIDRRKISPGTKVWLRCEICSAKTLIHQINLWNLSNLRLKSLRFGGSFVSYGEIHRICHETKFVSTLVERLSLHD